MSAQGRITHLFPGANTPGGFFSFYDHIAPVDANKVFVIKGGPGVGKSTFMRKIAEEILSDGYDVEFHHCSADNNSLDGVYIPAGQIALIDGTAPHVYDPKHPGAVDEILHLGDHWNEAAMRKPANKEAILRITREVSFRFKRAYDNLRAAHAFLEEWAAYYTDCLNQGALNECTEALIAELIPRQTGRLGTARRLFASAITYDGAVHWLDSIFGDVAKRIIVKGEPGTGKSVILGQIAQSALARGCRLQLFHCPMYPDRIDHLKISDANVAVITSSWPHEYPPRPDDRVIDTAAFLDHDRLAGYKPEIAAAKANFEAAIAREIHHLGMAKRLHDELEKSYVPHMDFAAIEQRRQDTLARIRALLSEVKE